MIMLNPPQVLAEVNELIDPFVQMTQVSWILDLYRLGQSITSLDNASRIYQQLLKHFADGMGASGGSLALRDSADSQKLKIVAGIKGAESFVGCHINLGQDFIGHVAQTGEPLFLNGLQNRRGSIASTDSRPESAICWPLLIDDHIIGVLCLNRYVNEPSFTLEHMEQGTVVLNLVSLALSNIKLHLDQHERIRELREAYSQMEEAHVQLLQSEKMATLGQIVAGIAHEINNPLGYVDSNFVVLEKYIQNLFGIIQTYETKLDEIKVTKYLIRNNKDKINFSALRENLFSLLSESKEGTKRAIEIVQALNEFSYAHTNEQWQLSDLHHGIDSTLNIVSNEIKYRARVIRDYGPPIQVECLPSQLNQVFMNLLINAAQAIDKYGEIIIRTHIDNSFACVEISDNGRGIPHEVCRRIFDPFFTTKPVGKGTGLGLSISNSIIQKHHGQIEVESNVNIGTTFKVYLPLRQDEYK